MGQTLIPNTLNRKKNFLKLFVLLIIISILTVVTLIYAIHRLAKPPDLFPLNEPVVIVSGTSLADITHLLKVQHVVRSAWLLKFILIARGESGAVKASTYIFVEPQDIYQVATRLIKGDFVSSLIRFTPTEGERVSRIARMANRTLTNFDIKEFLNKAIPLEGMLFPDTYFIPVSFSADQLVATMHATYEKNITPLRPKIVSSGLSEHDVITLASLVEREANSSSTMKMVAGILRKRLAMHMPLQVDISLEYVLNKSLTNITADDLTIDSPYNTYQHVGLPPTPIGNPGLTAIKAVLHPSQSTYLYYMTDNDGNFHFAKTFAEHKVNIARYLR